MKLPTLVLPPALLAEEEKTIRQDAAKCTTELLRPVFGGRL